MKEEDRAASLTPREQSARSVTSSHSDAVPTNTSSTCTSSSVSSVSPQAPSSTSRSTLPTNTVSDAHKIVAAPRVSSSHSQARACCALPHTDPEVHVRALTINPQGQPIFLARTNGGGDGDPFVVNRSAESLGKALNAGIVRIANEKVAPF